MDKRLANPVRAIRQELHGVERDRNVKVLLSCAVGSRAHGLDSPSSDHDVQFVYCGPMPTYVGLTARRDVIDGHDLRKVDGLDMTGWDVVKALVAVAASSPQVADWLRCPVRYHDVPAFRDELLDVAGEFSCRKAMGFHAGAAERQTRTGGAKGSTEDVLAKRHLYAVRPILCVLALSRRPHAFPPTDFEELRQEVRDHAEVRALGSALDDLVAVRRSGDRASMDVPVPAVQDFVDRMVPAVKALATDAPDDRSPDVMRLEDLLRRTLKAF